MNESVEAHHDAEC